LVNQGSPLGISMAGGSLAQKSSGKAITGVGATHPGKVVEIHGIEYRWPYRRTHETVELIKRYKNNLSFAR
jgi:alkanesulfonate monooxygenase SsuD/methylene tetrahydromethanopterin reductase-like flavin-dependent oxidoreductase (luciferase family)